MVFAAVANSGVGGLEEKLIPGELCLNDLNQFGPLDFGDGKACSKVEERLLLYFAANSTALDHANGSIGFVSGTAGQCLANIRAPTLARLCTKSSTSRKFRMWRFRPELAQRENDPSEVPTISLLVVTSDERLWMSVQPEFKSIDDVIGILLHLNYALQ